MDHPETPIPDLHRRGLRTVEAAMKGGAPHQKGTPPLPPSGRQHLIRHGHQRAILVERGGGLRRFIVDGHSIFDGYSQRVSCPGSRGLPMLPWPAGFGSDSRTTSVDTPVMPATEPARRHALHGFHATHTWAPRHVSTDEVVLGVQLCPELGYPCTVDVTISYRLDEAGLTVRTDATNIGEHSCLWGTGHHPYLTTGIHRIDPLRLQLHARRHLTTGTWGLPTGTAQVTGSLLDFGDGPTIGRQNLDLTFTDLARDPDGRAWVRLTGPDDRQAAIWLDDSYRFVGVCTAHTQPPPHFRTGLGLQPMTCPPSAFRTGRGLTRLEPGEQVTAAWGISSG